MVKMTRTVYLITLFAAFWMPCRSQNYPIGHRTITFTDSARVNRPVPSELYYPAATAGENTPLSNGMFPVIVFGHGFQMAYDSYTYFKNAIVPAGYILVFPKTETSLSPSHAEFGADLAFLVIRMKAEGMDPSSPFFQHVDSTSAIMGHSMGGGASFLGCKNNIVPTVMVTLAQPKPLLRPLRQPGTLPFLHWFFQPTWIVSLLLTQTRYPCMIHWQQTAKSSSI